MTPPRKIDQRDVDVLLAALTDRQIADLYEMSEFDVSKLRLSRRPKAPSPRQEQKNGGKDKP